MTDRNAQEYLKSQMLEAIRAGRMTTGEAVTVQALVEILAALLNIAEEIEKLRVSR